MIKNKNKSIFFYLMICALMPILFTGCYPEKFDDVEDWDITITINNPHFDDYYKIRTYFLVDSVSHGDEQSPKRTYDETILSAIKKNLNKLGWRAVESHDEADVVIFGSAINTDVYSYWQYYWYPYWDYYYPGYYPYYPYYPGGGFGGISYDYTEGTVAIQMNYTHPDEGTMKTPVIWLGIIDGVLNDSQSDITKRINTGVDQCFKDSPYLNER